MTRNFMCVMSLIVGFTFLARGSPAQAPPQGSDGIFFGSSVPSTDTVNNNAVLTGDQVTINGSVNGDVLAVGNEIDVNGAIQGSLIAIGQRVILNGKVSGSTYSSALEMTVKPSTVVDENLFYAGLSLNSEKGSTIRRDLYAGSLGAQMAGTVERNVQAIIGPVNLIQSLANAFGGKIVIPSFRQSPPSSPPSSGPNPTGLAVTPIVYREQSSSGAAVPTQIDTASLSNWALDRLREFLSLALIGLLVIWRAPVLFSRGAEMLRKKPFASAGYGVFDLVLAVNLSGVILLIIVLAFVIGLWLGPRTSWALSGAVWAVGFFATGLAVSLLWLFVFFVAKAIVAYFGGKLIFDRLSPKSAPNRIFPLLIGLLIVTLLSSIPTIGWVFDIAVISLGLGASWLVYRRRLARPEVMEESPKPGEQIHEGAIAYPMPVSGDTNRER